MYQLRRVFLYLIFISFSSNFAFAGDGFTQVNKPFAIEESTIQSTLTAIETHQITCLELLNQYLNRIKKYNLSTSSLGSFNAMTEINENVFEQAKQLDLYLSRHHKLKGPLHCVPVILKDNIDTADATTTSGTLALLGNQPNQDAFLVSKLRKSGAVILGKSSMDELASGISGISSRSGRIGNAFNPKKNPGGSSGGPAVAVSTNFALAAIGTDNSGSIRIPAAFNGIAGLRPSTGLISQTGIFPTGNLDGTAGPLTRTVEDLARVLDVIATADPDDQQTVRVPREKSYLSYLKKEGLRGKRIGIVRKVGTINTFNAMPEEISQSLLAALHLMQASGAIIIDDIQLPKFNNNRSVNMAGMKQDIDAYLKSYPAVRKNFEDICLSDRSRAFGHTQQCLKFIKSIPAKASFEYKKALNQFAQNRQYVQTIMKQYHLDALLLPISTQGIATDDPHQINTWQAPVASNAGIPAMTMILGYAHREKLPIGVELIAEQFNEGKLIEMIYAFEQLSPRRSVPVMPTANNDLVELDIPDYNNLLTRIGYSSYIDVLQKSTPDKMANDLNPTKFSAIVEREIHRAFKRRADHNDPTSKMAN